MKIGVLIVTYNRIEKLKYALEKYSLQTVKPEFIIVVNNSSADGTLEFLKEWKMQNENYEKYVLNLNENIGGSGGFYEGMKYSLNLNYDWLWLADDDAFPFEDSLEKADSFINNFDKIDKVSAICSSVINNGKIDYDHRRILKRGICKIKECGATPSQYEKKYFEIDLLTYVGALIKKDALYEVGLPNKDLFIYYDDSEHSYRLSRVGKILCVPSVKMEHNIDITTGISWKNFYLIRNHLYFYKRHFPKRYFWFEYYKESIKQIAKRVLGKNACPMEMVKKAHSDIKVDKLGKDTIYKPGWKINNG